MEKPRDEYGNYTYVNEDDIKSRIEQKYFQFEYIGGYEGCDSYIYLMCKYCGHTFKHGAHITRLSNKRKIECKQCVKISKQIKIRYNNEMIAEHKRADKVRKFWSQDFKQQEFKSCKYCGELFVGNKVYCCAEHMQKQNNNRKDKTYRNKISLVALAKRDSNVCWLCGGLVDWNDYMTIDGAMVFGNSYPSRDHVYPKSKGGSDDMDNIKLAHRICNSLKRDKVISPPRVC